MPLDWYKHNVLCVKLADNMAESWLTHSERQEHIELMPSIHKYTLAGIVISTFGPYFENDDRMAEMQNNFKLVSYLRAVTYSMKYC